MMIKVQHHDSHWNVISPDGHQPVPFDSGASAFDFADSLAREHHAETGDSSAVRVEVEDAYVDAVHYG